MKSYRFNKWSFYFWNLKFEVTIKGRIILQNELLMLFIPLNLAITTGLDIYYHASLVDPHSICFFYLILIVLNKRYVQIGTLSFLYSALNEKPNLKVNETWRYLSLPQFEFWHFTNLKTNWINGESTKVLRYCTKP